MPPITKESLFEILPSGLPSRSHTAYVIEYFRKILSLAKIIIAV